MASVRSPVVQHLCAGALGVLLGGFIVALFARQPWKESRHQQTNECSEASAPSDAEPAPKSKSHQRPVRRAYLTRPEELYVARDEEAEQHYRERQSNELIDLVMMRISGLSHAGFGDNAEVVAAGMAMYQKGMMDAVVRTAPDLVDELSTRIEQTICAPDAKAAQQVSLTRLIQELPELANPGTFDCIFGRGEEDIVLWTALDSWQAAGRPDTPGLSALRASARDARTQTRLTTPRDEHVPLPSDEQYDAERGQLSQALHLHNNPNYDEEEP